MIGVFPSGNAIFWVRVMGIGGKKCKHPPFLRAGVWGSFEDRTVCRNLGHIGVPIDCVEVAVAVGGF